jgi:hypothetical protein
MINLCWMALIPVAIGAVQGMQQGQAQKAQANAQAGALRQNALYLNNSSADTKVRGLQGADWSRVETQQLIGSQRSAMAGSGGVVDQDSNALLQQDAAQLGELDALTISNNAAREAYGYEVDARDKLLTAKTLKSNAKNAPMTSMLGGAISGAGSSFSGGLFGGGAAGGASGGTYGSTGVAVNGQQGFRAGFGPGR